MKNIVFGLSIMLVVILTGCSSTPQEEVDTSTQVFIKSPEYGQKFYTGHDSIILKASALSMNGNHSNQIKWTSNIDGLLGVGAELSVALNIGDHVITASYSDERTSGEDNTEVHVINTIHKAQSPSFKLPIREVIDQDNDILVVDYNKNIIIDKSKKLMWMRKPDSYKYTFKQAKAFANKCAHAGYNDWRLPTINELSDISNIYHDGRNSMLHREFGNEKGGVWTISEKQPNFAMIVKYIEVLSMNNALRAEIGYADKQMPLHIRLVRNAI